ncbi:TonB-dependent receptor [Croceicoccus sp. F390]|uniref:TonB-dependent receptor n=1 Tax=Croceicoccus esteveae TaxID=3075597 RepID=A0ABU2ZHY6_9SPHN|nr:TonB-dependent receptor [Croceicoccus sp. F390]MDT0575914.1 TonB-dependent receptor [Croceicoccus sp. F390]
MGKSVITVLLVASSLSAAMLAMPAAAQDVVVTGSTPAAPGDDFHEQPLDTIVVTAVLRKEQRDQLTGTTVLAGQELTRALRSTIGETLSRQPGVSATSFGPNASRPVLRGLQGERVRVLTDGIGSFDVSNTSVDHAVAINPLTADRIEIIRGPSALLFGSSAIGGVVNVVDNRIPRRVPGEIVHAEGLATLGSASQERAASAAIDVPLAGKFVLHVDGSYSRNDDLDIGGFVLVPAARAVALASSDPDVAALAELRGTLPNSAAETYEIAGGAAMVVDSGNMGFSVNHFDSRYGVPVRYALTPDAQAEEVRLHARQTRADLRAEIDLAHAFVDSLRVRAGVADYRHDELEDTGEIGTSFFNQSIEARLELVQTKRAGWSGAIGGQLFIRDFDVVGEEKFVPKNETRQLGIFTLQSHDFGRLQVEAGARYEHLDVVATADAMLGNPDVSRAFDVLSGSIGASLALNDGLRVSINAIHSQRAPSAEELFANGPHAGTQAFEVGNPALDPESSNGIEATLRSWNDRLEVNLSAFYTRFEKFIYERATGAVEDGLPVFAFLQEDAEFMGFEAEVFARAATVGPVQINVDGLADYTRAKVIGRGPVPRIPPLRMAAGIEGQTPRVDARLEIEHVFRQGRVIAMETPTGAYSLVNASLEWRPLARSRRISLMFIAANLFDVNARRHASFLKDYAPLAGRDFRVSARMSF